MTTPGDPTAHEVENPSVLVTEAARLLDQARVARMVAGDADTAARLATLARLTLDEGEMLENVARGYMVPKPTHPPGAALGWLLRYDASTRAIRRVRGLSLPGEVANLAT